MPLAPLPLKPSPRIEGAELPIVDESHVVGEDDAGFVWLDEVPLQAVSGASVAIPGFTEVLPLAPGILPAAPGPGEFRVFYTGLSASAVEFNAADDGEPVLVSYTGRGGAVLTRDYNRIKAFLDDTRATLDTTAASLEEAQATLATTVTSVGEVQGAVRAIPGRYLAVPRFPGTEAQIIDEAHVVGAEDANLVWLNEVPLQADPGPSVFIDAFTEVLAPAPGAPTPAPAPGEFRVHYDGPLASAVEFNAADSGQPVQVSYTGRGGTLTARAFGRMAVTVGETETLLDDTRTLLDDTRAVLDDTRAVVDGIPATYVAKGEAQSFDVGGPILSFATDEENGGPFQMTLQRFDNPVGDRQNNVMRWGYNISDGGGRVDATKHALALEIESFYRPQENQEWTEAHLAFRTAGGRLIRPWTMEADVNAGDPGASSDKLVRLRMEADEFNITGPQASGSRLNVTSGGVQVMSPIPIRHMVNNTQFLMQLNPAATTFSPVIKLNAQNEVELGSTSVKAYAPAGLILRSPNGTRYQLVVANDGTLSTVAV